jgi:hypothetical protein
MIQKRQLIQLAFFLNFILAEKKKLSKMVILPFCIFIFFQCCKFAKSQTLIGSIVSFYPKPVRIIPHTLVKHYSMRMFSHVQKHYF